MFDSLPDAARVWLFPLDRTLNAAATDVLRESLAGWLSSWTSHGRPVRAEADVLEGRVLAVGAVISLEERTRPLGAANAGVSGCGIDTMERAVASAMEAAGVGLASALGVTTRDADGAWTTLSRPAFRRLVRDGEADARTRVLDVTAETVGTLRERGVERAAGEAWHARAFRLAA